MKKPSGPPPAEPKQSGPDVGLIDALAKIADRYDLSELEIERAGLHVRLSRQRAAAAAPASYAAPAPPPAPVVASAAPAAPAAEGSAAEHAGAVKSPMVGTAYLRPSPEAKTFVDIGSIVKAGDKIALVEAMKTFNEIVAPRAGRVTQIFIEDGDPVEFGQALMVIE